MGWIAAAAITVVLMATVIGTRRRATRLALRYEELQREIVGRECIERQLQASQSNLQMATEASGVGTWYWDLQNDEVSCSEQAIRLFDLDPSKGVFKSKDFISKIHPDDQDRLRGAIEKAFREAALYQMEYRIFRRDKTIGWLASAGRALRDSDGEVRRLAGITTDVTDRKRLEENFYQAQKMDAVGRLAGGVAHDFNNMLGVISAYAELLVEEPGLSPRAAKRVTEITNATQRANALTRQLLAFSRKQVTVPTNLDLNDVILGVKDMLQRLVGEDVVVATNLKPGLPAIHADRGQLEQVLLNFATNSRDAMPKGGRFELKTSLQKANGDSSSPQGDGVLLEVSDTGCGMTPEVIKHVFEPFFTTKAVGRGTGLGLATVYGVIEQAHGSVKVQSTPGVGTTFLVQLPAVMAAAAREVAFAPMKAQPASSARILLVEDEPSLREVLTQFMEAEGMRVFSASGGQDALATIDTGEAIDVLLTDLVMPEMDGRTLAQNARSKCPKLHVIYMSGHTDDTLMQKELLTEGLGYLQKPFTRAELMKAIQQSMRPVA